MLKVMLDGRPFICFEDGAIFSHGIRASPIASGTGGGGTGRQ